MELFDVFLLRDANCGRRALALATLCSNRRRLEVLFGRIRLVYFRLLFLRLFFTSVLVVVVRIHNLSSHISFTLTSLLSDIPTVGQSLSHLVIHIVRSSSVCCLFTPPNAH